MLVLLVSRRKKRLDFGRFEAKRGIAAYLLPYLLATLVNASSCHAFLCEKSGLVWRKLTHVCCASCSNPFGLEQLMD
jgi:hypothetical protein